MKSNRAAAQTLQLEDLVVERYPLGRHKANAYLVYSLRDGRAVVLDPGWDGAVLIDRTVELQLTIDGILLTHGHWDHVGAAHEVSTYAQAPVYAHPGDRSLIRAAPLYAFRIDGVRLSVPASLVDLEDGAAVPLGGSRSVSVRHLPGHTEGGLVYRLGRAVFTGDTLMPTGAGPADRPGGDPAKLHTSLAALRRELTSDDVLCPGHGCFWPATEATAWLESRTGTAG